MVTHLRGWHVLVCFVTHLRISDVDVVNLVTLEKELSHDGAI